MDSSYTPQKEKSRNSEPTLRHYDPLKKLFRKLFDKLPPGTRGHIVAVLGELISTIMFFFLFFAAIESSNVSSGTGVTIHPMHSTSQLLYIALSAGFSFIATGWASYRISGGLFNPMISFGLALIGAITWIRCALLFFTQTLATITAAYMVDALFRGDLNVGTGLGNGTSIAQGIIIEMLLTAQLTFTVFMLATEKHDATYLAPIGIGLSITIAMLVGIEWTGASLNPARSLAPCVVNKAFDSYHWIYWVGPICGVFLAVLFYNLVKALEYETAQEISTDVEHNLSNPHHRNSSFVNLTNSNS
ncbi:hypothetical protein Golomagni_03457 [Golovinomyces magnicellulatus]|nr:hypothetical protein Golomagni_03457 [Golovinomyces magnicellulatus]